jgi:hypothetical protein
MVVRRVARLSLGQCHGWLDEIASGWLGSVWQESYGESLRMCALHARSRSGPYESAYGLFMERVGWRGWRVAGVLGIAG